MDLQDKVLKLEEKLEGIEKGQKELVCQVTDMLDKFNK